TNRVPPTAATVVRVLTAVDPDAPCNDENESVCQFVYDHLGRNETLADVASWLVDRPLRMIVILLVAWILSIVARRWGKRVVARIIAPSTNPIQRLERMGIEVTSTMAPNLYDPRRESRSTSISAVLTSTIVVSIWTIALITVL